MHTWKHILLSVFTGVIICTGSTGAFADTLLLRDGEVVSGTISAETSTDVTIDAVNGRFTFPREKILTVTRESPVQNQIREMEKLLAQGNLEAAMVFYHRNGLSEHLTTEAFNKVLLDQLKPVAGAVLATSATAVGLADKLLNSSPAPSELLIFAAALCIESQNADKTLMLLREIEKDVPAHLNWSAETVSLLLDRIARTALESNQGAILAVAASLAGQLPLPATQSSDYLAIYAKIEDKARRKDYLSASSLFTPDLFLHRADLFVPQAERLVDSILATPPTAETLAALESSRVTILPYINQNVTLRAMKALINRLLSSNRHTEAQQVVDMHAKNDPDMSSTLQHLIDFQKRKAALPPDSPMETYKLASWSRGMGLLDEARSLFLTLRSDPRFAETVNLQLSLIDHAQAEETVARLRYLYDTNDIERLKTESATFLRTSPEETYAQQARDLVQLADFQTWSTKRSSHGKAEAEFQQAERLANRREFDQALIHLNRIQIDRKDSAAAAKAQALRDRIMREKLKEK